MKFNFQFNSIQFNSILLILLISLFASCKEEDLSLQQEQKIFSKEVLSKDVNFIHFVDIHKTSSAKFLDRMEKLNESEKEITLNRLNYLGSLGSLDENQLNEVAELLGFNSFGEYKVWQNDLINTVGVLRAFYPQFAVDKEATVVVEKAALLVLTDSKNLYKQQATCDQKYSSCSNQAHSALVVASAGCVGSVFLPVVGPAVGVACQIGAIGYHYNSIQICISNYDDCQN